MIHYGPFKYLMNPEPFMEGIFATLTKMSVSFDFLIFVFFLLSPYVIVFYLYRLVICKGFGGMKHSKQDFIHILFSIQ